MILETKQISKRFGSIVAADRIDLSVGEATSYGILGPNGSGKTTTLGIVLSVIKPDQGWVKWFGKEPAPSSLKQIGSLLEVPNFFPYLSLARNLEVIGRIKEVDLSEIDRVLDETGLLDRKKSRFDTLSSGMKQRLALAAALLGNPKVLVLDEPANGLDPEGIAEVRNLIIDQREKGKTIIMASHILDEVEKVCTHAGILKKGQMIASGEVSELLKMDDVIIIGANDILTLKKIVEASGLVKNITLSGNHLEVVLARGQDVSSINRLAYEKGVILTELRVRKSTLEEQFLELVK
ncbi:MAG TPA: ATP-binding cassette domain-containing protein [Bacteroidales bacterium]|nr:ATP-binding cassette domain-containing protein [Bacteroidales bacterium]